MAEPYILVKLTEREKRLIEELRKLAYGEVVVYIQDKEPVRIEKRLESVKL